MSLTNKILIIAAHISKRKNFQFLENKFQKVLKTDFPKIFHLGFNIAQSRWKSFGRVTSTVNN